MARHYVSNHQVEHVDKYGNFRGYKWAAQETKLGKVADDWLMAAERTT